jgi:GH24 family phage-related lysozyme (muramidase)
VSLPISDMNELLRGMNPAGADAVTRRQPGVYGQMAGPLLGAAPMPERSPVDEAVDFIAKEEGFRREAYKDLAGAGHPWTVGYGRTGPDVGPETVMEEPEAREWLASRVRGDSARLVNMGLPANPGLLSFVYNAGHGRLRSTGAVEAGLRNDWDGVADALRRVTFGRNAAHEKVQLPVLVRRREAEIDLLLRDVLEGGSKSNVMDQDQR